MSTPITLDVATLPGGVRIPYAEHGSPDGIPVVMLHGISDSWRSFEPVLPHLPDHVHAFSLTQRGHGDASRPGSYTLDDLVGDVAGFMDAVGLESAVVCGHSMGSIVATRFAIEHPERTRGLIAMGAAYSFAQLELDEMAEELAAMTEPLDVEWLRGFQESTIAQPVADGLIDMAVAESAKLDVATLRALWHDAVLVDFAADLGRIVAPTLVMSGELDEYAVAPSARALARAIPRARRTEYAGAGHAMHWEEPARAAADIAAFAEEVAS